jgi:glycosyltransferase involved in cell wall biosynthesis
VKILTVVPDLGVRGTQRAAVVTSLALAARGHEVAVLAHSGDGPRRRQLEEAGIAVLGGRAGLPVGLETAQRFAPAVVHIHRPGMANPKEGLLLRKLAQGAPILETNVFGRVDYSTDAELIDVHLQISRYGLWRWRRWLGSRRARTLGALVPYPVAPGPFRPLEDPERKAIRARLGVPPDAFLCGHVGYKLSRFVIDAFTSMASREGNAWLVCLPLPPPFDELVRQLPDGIRRRVVALPESDSDEELGAVYGALDCLVHAAVIGESFGLVLAEAMLCGVPVVTASRPHRDNSHLELVGHLEGGVVTATAHGLGEGLELLRTNSDLRHRLGQAGRASVLARYHPDAVAALVERVATHALAHRSRAALADALVADPQLAHDVPDSEIDATLGKALGRPSPSELALRRIVLHPTGQRLVSFVRRELRRPFAALMP